MTSRRGAGGRGAGGRGAGGQSNRIFLVRAAVVAHRWQTTVAMTALLGVAAWVNRSNGVPVPLLDQPVPARFLAAIAVTAIALHPLYAAFPALEATLTREPALRLVRVLVAPGLAFLSMSPAWASGPPDRELSATIFLTVALASAGIAAVVLIGELAWTAPLTLGILALIADGGRDQHITRVLGSVPPWLATVPFAVAATAYVRVGGRGIYR